MDAFELAVAEDLSIGIIELEGAEQSDEGGTLGRSTGVCSTTFLVETSLVTDTNRVGIVVAGMGADHLLRAALMKLAVTSDVVVVAAAVPAFGPVHLVEKLERYMLVRAACRTMNDYKINTTHDVYSLMFIVYR